MQFVNKGLGRGNLCREPLIGDSLKNLDANDRFLKSTSNKEIIIQMHII